MSPKSRVRSRQKWQPSAPIDASPPEESRRGWRVGFRPRWHKAVAWLLIVSGAALFFICSFNGWHLHQHGGHVWYLVGIAIAATSTWWFGLFDKV